MWVLYFMSVSHYLSSVYVSFKLFGIQVNLIQVSQWQYFPRSIYKMVFNTKVMIILKMKFAIFVQLQIFVDPSMRYNSEHKYRVSYRWHMPYTTM